MIFYVILVIFVTNFNFSVSVSENKILDEEYANLPSVFYQDNYDECMLLNEKALYCNFKYTVQPLSSAFNSLWQTIKNVSSDDYNYRHDILRHGICVPKTCPDAAVPYSDLLEKLTKCYNEKFKSLHLKGHISDLECDTREPKYPVDLIDITIGIFFLIYVAVVLIATSMDHIYKYKVDDEMLWNKTMCALSITKNWNRLKTVQKNEDVERLRCIQGIRFYNMILVIFCHTLLTSFVMPIANPKVTEKLTDRFSTIFLTSGPLSVSTFFMISAYLLINSLLTVFKDRKEIDVKTLLLVFVNRWLRLTPTLAIVIAFQVTWLRHLGNGPNWNHYVGNEFLHCRTNWWTNLLYINNYVDVENMCLLPTWYLALDTQYFIILLVLIWLIKKYPRCVWYVLTSALLLHIVFSFMENYKHDFPAVMIPRPESLYDLNHTLKNKQWRIQYISFYGNLAGPLVGLCFGYLYYRHKERKLLTTKVYSWIWWSITHSFGYGIIIIPGLLSLSKTIDHDRLWSSIYTAFSRIIFSVGIGLGIFGTTYGIGGIVRNVLSWPPLYVLGRLTYSAYLVHVPLLFLRNGMARFPLYICDYYLFFELAGNLTATYLAATVVTLIFEMPIYQLQKIILPLRKTQSPKTTKKSKKKK